MLTLEFPNYSHKKAYESMKQTWALYERIPTSPRALFRGENFDEFLQYAQNDLTENNAGVPATLYFLMDGEKILGGVQIRHSLNHPRLSKFGGHIGYGVLPTERNKGYASSMLSLALDKARNLGLEKVMIGCDDTNIASMKVIEKNGGVFERYSEDDVGEKTRVYWIHLAVDGIK